MTSATFNDRDGSRGRQHRNFICHGGVAVAFRGSSIPGCRVMREQYEKNGKWSHSTWECELAEGFTPLVFSQDWETGEWFNSRTWAAALTERGYLLDALGGDASAVERFIRTHCPRTAARLDMEAEQAGGKTPAALSAAFAALAEAEQAKALAEAGAARDLEVAAQVRNIEKRLMWAQDDLREIAQKAEDARNIISRKGEIEAALIEAEGELAQAKAEVAAAELLRKQDEQAAAIRRQAEALRQAKGRKMSLADLQAMARG